MMRGVKIAKTIPGLQLYLSYGKCFLKFQSTTMMRLSKISCVSLPALLALMFGIGLMNDAQTTYMMI